MKLTAYIFAGGQSRRFGSDKAMARLPSGQTLLQQNIATLTGCECINEVIVVAQHAEQYPDAGVRVIGDLQPNLGPIGGLTTALTDLADAPEDRRWAMIISCDLVNLQRQHVETLAGVITSTKTKLSVSDEVCRSIGADSENGNRDVEAVLFQSDHFQPFPGVYSKSILSRLSSMLSRSDNRQVSMRGLAAQLESRLRVVPMVCKDSGEALPRLKQCNTRAEFESYIQPMETNE